MRNIILLFIVCTVSLIVYAQQKTSTVEKTKENYVRLYDKKGKCRCFNMSVQPKLEIKNGKMNIAVTNDSNELFQVNGIHEQWLKDTVLKSAPVNVVLIAKDATFTSQDKSFIKIKCSENKPGSKVTISIKAKIVYNHQYFRVEAQVTGLLPEKQSVHTH